VRDKDNIVIFVILDGEACDDGSHLLAKDNKASAIKDATLRRARVIKQGSRYLISNKDQRASAFLQKKILKEALRSLYDVILDIKFTNNIRVQNRCGLRLQAKCKEIPMRTVL
jgi:hypothetical protein